MPRSRRTIATTRWLTKKVSNRKETRFSVIHFKFMYKNDSISAMCNLTCWRGHICAISQVMTEGMDACLQKGNFEKPQVIKSSNDYDQCGMSLKGRFVTAGILLAFVLLAILITIVAIHIRYKGISRQLQYNALSD